jgi:2-oxoisovalerate dehydrogenase E2 component (dihydrolipoyl transacylase)
MSMGVHVIKMPDIGEGIAEVELVAWNVGEGDAVVEDQSLVDVMTDKATVEIPSPVRGKVLAFGGRPGQTIAVGAELIRIEVEGAGNLKQGAAAPPPPAHAPAPPADAAAAPAPAGERSPIPERAGAGAPGAGRARQISRPVGDKPVASPAVRAHAWELGIDLQYVQGTGPAGRITREDIDAYAERGQVGGTGADDIRYVQNDDEERIEIIGLRRKIAQKMQDAKRRIPHFAYVEEIDVTELEALRATLNLRHGEARGRLTVLPFIMRALVLAVREYPKMNARFDDDAGVVTHYGAVHLGIATQTDGGLMVPVLAHAETLDLWACAAEVSRLAEAARAGRLAREELSGSTITITSLGPLGGITTTPVINAPEVAIVGINRIVERPTVREHQIVVRKMMNLSSSFDHRVVDGLHAARFVQAIRGYLETPALLFIE